METGLLNKVALVTGASGAIGRAAARHLAAEGASVAVSWHTNRGAAGWGRVVAKHREVHVLDVDHRRDAYRR